MPFSSQTIKLKQNKNVYCQTPVLKVKKLQTCGSSNSLDIYLPHIIRWSFWKAFTQPFDRFVWMFVNEYCGLSCACTRAKTLTTTDYSLRSDLSTKWVATYLRHRFFLGASIAAISLVSPFASSIPVTVRCVHTSLHKQARPFSRNSGGLVTAQWAGGPRVILRRVLQQLSWLRLS